MHKIIRLFRILFENLFINYKKYDKDFKLETNNTLVSFNIRADHPRDNKNNWVYRRNAIIEFIKNKKPGIICMQEVQSHMFKWLYKRLFNQYDCIEIAGNKKHNSLLKNLNWFSNGLVIWYDKTKYDKGWNKYITEEHNHPEKFLLLVDLIFDKGIITIINTHYDSIYQHKRQMLTDKLNKVIKSNSYPVYVCGDFNAGINSNEIKSINLPYCVPFSNEIQRTFNHFDDTWAIIDFIFSSKEMNYDIHTKDYGVSYISDHYPIIINL
jgi:endonuclease/exonuclease/phosphatase family metal-dependent hydrolase